VFRVARYAAILLIGALSLALWVDGSVHDPVAGLWVQVRADFTPTPRNEVAEERPAVSPLIVPVIMCGGAGARLWPVSRESMPKQFVRLVGQETTFQEVLARVSDRELFARPIVITHGDFRFVVAEQLRERGIEADIVLEPVRRDSGPAVAVSAVLATQRDRDALVLVLAADHIIRKPENFHEACRRAAVAAAEGRIVTFGIEPTYPATNYGYIRPGEKLNGASVRAVEAFVEKPDAEIAATYVAERYLWNSGNFLFHAATMLGEIERFEPGIAEAAKAAVAGLTRDLDFLRLAGDAFAISPPIPIPRRYTISSPHRATEGFDGRHPSGAVNATGRAVKDRSNAPLSLRSFLGTPATLYDARLSMMTVSHSDNVGASICST
jgi:mannose-1-phosphate guanylyltransferase